MIRPVPQDRPRSRSDYRCYVLVAGDVIESGLEDKNREMEEMVMV